jgi:GT2 family glycosyltransferase/glycosyltransferase involved in cell wall biosynthesis
MKPKMLVLAKTLPLHDRASGDYRLFQILDILRKDVDIDFLSTTHTTFHKAEQRLDYIVRDSTFNFSKVDFLDQKYIDDLKAIGVNPLVQAEPVPITIRPTNDFDIRPYLAKKQYDIVWVEFFYLADQYIGDIRRFQPGARVICDSVDLHFRRLARQSNYLEQGVRYHVNFRHEKRQPDEAAHRQKVQDHRNYADHVRENELSAYSKCDAVVAVSEDDRQEMARYLPNLPILYIPNIHRQQELVSGEGKSFVKRSGCVFVGNFDHNPNVSAAIYLKHEVAPFLENTDIKFQIVGSNPPKIVRTLGKFGQSKERFQVTGYVPETAPYLARARVSVAPILFGAGMNGKIGEAMAAGLPVVTTSLGALGMGLTNGENCLVADDPEGFANAIRALHENEALWKKIRANGLAYLKKSYSRTEIERHVRSELQQQIAEVNSIRRSGKLLKTGQKIPGMDLRLPAPAFPAPVKKPKFTVIILAFNQWKFTELCLRSLAHAQAKHPQLKVEYLLVDNASSDGTAANAGKIKNLRVLANKDNLGFAGGNNSGIRAAKGEHIVILNNDTIVPPDWLERLNHHLETIPDLGILGPSTNTESGQAISGVRYNSIRDLFEYNERLGRDQTGAWERVKKISGLCMLLPRSTIEKVGMLDTDFGIGYFEDDDLCLRAEDKGLKLVWAKDVFVHHFGSMSFEGNSLKRAKFLEEGMAKFAFKWGKRGLEHIAKAHKETLLRSRKPKTLAF